MIYDCLFYFNRRSRKGSDHVEKTDYPHRPCISIRAPARGATVSLVTRDSAHKHFNPRSREGSDAQVDNAAVPAGISIHAPARGATPVKIMEYMLLIFQSALPRGERPRCRDSHITYFPISIRAPARGATPSAAFGTTGAKFQSTLPRGERLGTMTT